MINNGETTMQIHYIPKYYDPNTLYHHGIKGQEWGVRNGPPYPLDHGRHGRRAFKKLRKINSKKNLAQKTNEERDANTVKINKSFKMAAKNIALDIGNLNSISSKFYKMEDEFYRSKDVQKKIESHAIKEGWDVNYLDDEDRSYIYGDMVRNGQIKIPKTLTDTQKAYSEMSSKLNDKLDSVVKNVFGNYSIEYVNNFRNDNDRVDHVVKEAIRKYGGEKGLYSPFDY